MDECGLAGLEAAELEQTIVGGTEGDRHTGRLLDGQALGNRPTERLVSRSEFGVGSVQAHGDYPVTLGESADRLAYLQHGAGALIADDVGGPGDVPAQPVEGVAPFDAHRLDPHQDVGRAHYPDRGSPHTGTPRVHRSGSTPLLSLAPPIGSNHPNHTHRERNRTVLVESGQPSSGKSDRRKWTL